MNDLIKIVRVHDPVFSESLRRGLYEIETVTRYARSREWSDLPPIPPDLDPVVFHCKRLSRSTMLRIERLPEGTDRFVAAFAAGVVRVTGGDFGAGWEPTDSRREDYAGMTPGEAEAMFVLACEADIGAVIYWRSYLPKAPRPLYPVRLSSLHGLDVDASPSAEQSPTGAATTSEEPRDR